MSRWYIVASEITSVDLESDDIYAGLTGIRMFQLLPREFGFMVVTWNPDIPDKVREIYWNTAEQRQQDHHMGRIVERKAAEWEVRDGRRQHEEALARV